MTAMYRRRAFLQGLTVGAGALAFLPMLRASAAGTQPLRFIGIFHWHGASSPLFRMRPGETETQFDLRYTDCVLSPFDDAATYGRSFKDKVLLLEGVDLATAIESGRTGHDAPASILTGTGSPNGPSLDQFLAVNRKLGAATRVTSLVLSVGHNYLNHECLSHGAGGTPLGKIIDPRQTFDVAFKDVMVGTDPAAQAAADRERRRGQSVIDFIRGDLQRLHGRLAPVEQRKLDQHLTAIRDLEKRLEVLPPTGPTCAVPGVPKTFPAVHENSGGRPYFEEITNLQVDLMAQAMACDITRFGTLWLNDLSNGSTANTGITGLPDDCHADLAHRYAGPLDNIYGSGRPGDPSSWAQLGKQNRYSYSKCARLLQRFNELGVLDDVLVMMSGDMGDPNAHSNRNVPIVLAGGAGGKFRMGRRLNFHPPCPPERYICDDTAFVPHNKLLVSIAHAFGQTDVTAFGSASDVTLTQGTLPGLT